MYSVYTGKMKNGLKILVGKSEVVSPRFGPRRRWNGKIKMVGKLGHRKVDWIKLAWVKASHETLAVYSLVTARLLYMFRTLSASIIRSTKNY
jgi:hypothetical protein